ncbi:Elongator subunit elp2 [Paramarasmius palmivorus]|uniref:Elongator complex protein 2 n=1 Tax=Paramarasmius palmivorus TaxID=297713 RepID=A0AAW0DG66_9AGAR
MYFQTNYIAASTNRYPNAADIASDSTVFFGSSSQVCIWRAEDKDSGITEALYGHEGIVTCIRSLSPTSFISADDKGVVHYWTKEGGSQARQTLSITLRTCTHSPQWKSSKFQAHEKAVSSMCASNDCLVTGSSDSSVKVWKFSKETGMRNTGVAKDCTIRKISTFFSDVLPSRVTKLVPQPGTVLAIGLTDRNVQIWTRTDDKVGLRRIGPCAFAHCVIEKFARAVVLTGHDDWVKSLSFSPLSSGTTLVLASGSQDGTIRLWNVEPYKKNTRSENAGTLSDELLDAFEESLGDFADVEEGGRQVSLKRHILSVKNDQGSLLYSITFDALLIGHEAGVTSISWQPNKDIVSNPTLLSTSTDSSVIIWSPSAVITHSGDTTASIWINRQRFGDVGGQRLGGFVGGLWKGNGKEVMSWGWSGGWRRWRCVDEDGDIWAEVGAIGGHSGQVKDLDWSPNGAYIISAGLDQTSRIHGPIMRESTASWHELARPQVHGYDLLGAVFLGDLRFASCADEKVTRVFEGPQLFVDLVETLGVAQVRKEGPTKLLRQKTKETRPAAASVPPLGLSNKATENSTPVTPVNLTRRPFEGELASVTLWPEIEKVFGHGYESSTIAVSASRKYIATACRATSAEHAVVRVNETSSWQPFGAALTGHSLTVTRISFSPNDEYVISVSRDRSWRMFKKTDQGYTPVASEPKAHGRIIWDCAWSHEGDFFATASRDKTVKIWGQDSPEKWSLRSTIKCPEAATAVDFMTSVGDQHLLAVGLETGDITIYSSTSYSSWDAQGTL